MGAAISTGAERREALPGRLRPGPPLRQRVAFILDRAIADAARRHPGDVVVLDAGCGHRSPLAAFRSRIGTLVGIDIAEPEHMPAYLDAFSTVDLCDEQAVIPAASFDVVLSHFTIEHLSRPGIAIANLQRSLRPGGTVVLVTVNRRHPFVDAYLRLPGPVRDRLQRTLKAAPENAHPLVGACNDPGALADALRSAGLARIEIETVGNLARAWGHHRAGRALGVIGDLLFQRLPSRRSTIIASATRPIPAEAM